MLITAVWLKGKGCTPTRKVHQQADIFMQALTKEIPAIFHELKYPVWRLVINRMQIIPSIPLRQSCRQPVACDLPMLRSIRAWLLAKTCRLSCIFVCVPAVFFIENSCIQAAKLVNQIRILSLSRHPRWINSNPLNNWVLWAGGPTP